MRSHQCLVHLQIRRRSAQALHIDAPFVAVQAERLQSASLAGQLDGIDPLIPAVISCTGVALGVFVGHGRAEGIEDGAGGEVFAGDEDDGFALALDFFFLRLQSDRCTRRRGEKVTMISATSGSISTRGFSRSWHAMSVGSIDGRVMAKERTSC